MLYLGQLKRIWCQIFHLCNLLGINLKQCSCRLKEKVKVWIPDRCSWAANKSSRRSDFWFKGKLFFHTFKYRWSHICKTLKDSNSGLQKVFCHTHQENVVVQSLTHQHNYAPLKSLVYIVSHLLNLISHLLTSFQPFLKAQTSRKQNSIKPHMPANKIPLYWTKNKTGKCSLHIKMLNTKRNAKKTLVFLATCI